MHSIKGSTGLAIVVAVIMLGACSGDSAEALLLNAKKKLALHDTNAALIQLKNALQKQPGSAEARFLLGGAMLETGDIGGALVELQKAQDFGYNRDEVTPLLAKAQLAQGPAGKVLSAYGSIVLANPSAQAALQTVLANAYLELGKSDEAQSALAKALAIQSDYIPAQLLQVSMLASTNKLDAASETLEKIIQRVPLNSQAWQTKGDIAIYRGRTAEARSAYQAAVERDKFNLAAHSAGIWLSLNAKDFVRTEEQLASMRAVASFNPQTKLFSALLAFEKDDLKSAYEQSLQLLKFAPDNVKVLHLTGAIELRRNALFQAETNLTKALQIDPEQDRVRSLLAQTHLRAGDSAKAIKVLSPMMLKNESSWEANSLMAEALMQNGDQVQAQKYFAKAATLNPSDARSRTALATIELSRGQVEQGIDALRSISAADSSSMADLELVNALMVKKDYEGALQALKKLEVKLPKLPVAAYLRGQLELQRGQTEKARVAFEAALKIDPAYFPASASLSAIDWDAGKPELAREHFARILVLNPTDIRANLGLIALQIKSGAKVEDLITALNKLIRAAPSEAVPRIMLVRLHLDRNDFKAASAAAQDGVTANPDNAELVDLLGQVQQAAGDINQAIGTYKKLEYLRVNSYEPYMRLANLYLAQKDNSSAVLNLRKALNIKVDLYDAQRKLMFIDLSAGRISEALATAKTVQAQRSGESIGFMLEGDIYTFQRNWEAAAKSYRTGFAKSASTELVVKLQNVLLAQKNLPEAKKLELEWLKGHADDSVYLFYLGDIEMARGDYESAQGRYQAVVRLKPDNAAALNNLAWVINKNNKQGALPFALKATSLAPNQPAYLDTLADIYAAAGNFAKAIEAQRAAVALAPEFHAHRLHLARLLLRAGDNDQARKELSVLRDLGEKFADQVEVSEMIRKL